MTDICYVISHGFAARMLLQTDLVLSLANSGKKIAIISLDSKDENLQAFTHPNIQLFESNEKDGLWNEDYLFRRKYYLEDVRNNTALWEKHIYGLYHSTSLHPWRRIRPVFYYLIYILIKYFPSIRRRFLENEHKNLQSKEAADLIAKINPRLVVSTYPVSFLEAKILFAAKQKGIKTLTHLLSWDNISCKGKFPVTTDSYIAWGTIMQQELKEYYNIDNNNIHVCGIPHFDHHITIKNNPDYESLLEKMGLNPYFPYLFMAMSSPRFAPKEIEIAEWLAKSIQENIFGSKMQLIIRPHPQNVQGNMADLSWIERLKKIQSNRIVVDFPKLVKSKIRWSMTANDMDRLSNLLVGTSLCINSGSTVSIDALMVNKPVILTAFDGDNNKITYWRSARRLIDYPHLKKLVNLGGVEVVKSYKDFELTIKKYLASPEYELSNRKNALIQECYKNDGQSTQRVKEAILDILKKLEKNTAVSKK